MRNLLFPVKLAWILGACITLAAAPSCGYQPAYSADRGPGPLRVVAAQPKVARLDAVQATLAGARAELSRRGGLRPGSGYPRMVVEVLRIDERSSGIAVDPLQPQADRVPLARGSSVGVLGRAWIEDAPGAPARRDTGDMRRVETYASQPDARLEAIRHDEAVRAAARQLGRALARRVLGQPTPDIEPM